MFKWFSTIFSLGAPETSQGARSKEKRLFSQASQIAVIQPQLNCTVWPSATHLQTIQIYKGKKCNLQDAIK